MFEILKGLRGHPVFQAVVVSKKEVRRKLNAFRIALIQSCPLLPNQNTLC